MADRKVDEISSYEFDMFLNNHVLINVYPPHYRYLNKYTWWEEFKKMGDELIKTFDPMGGE